jgi:hypothetical protein
MPSKIEAKSTTMMVRRRERDVTAMIYDVFTRAAHTLWATVNQLFFACPGLQPGVAQESRPLIRPRRGYAAHVRSVIVLVFASACAGSVVVDTESAMVAWSADRACKSDDECVIVDDCCSCSAGGGRIGVNTSALTAVNARRGEACSTDNSIASPDARRVTPVTCTNVASTSGSCAPSARAACRANVCRVVE